MITGLLLIAVVWAVIAAANVQGTKEARRARKARDAWTNQKNQVRRKANSGQSYIYYGSNGIPFVKPRPSRSNVKGFVALCACPECGWYDVHYLNHVRYKGKPNDTVTRKCNQDGCDGRWKQEK